MVLYIIGLVVALMFVVFGIDDLLWDLFFIIKPNHSKASERIPIEELDNTLPKLLAVVIAAWKEDNVLGDVISNLIETAQYPTSMYHIFLGVYPNDEKTLAVARELSGIYKNVHVMINPKAGPTTKADNINSVLREIRDFEKERGWEFAGFVIHDSEDVVHPYEFKLENYLLNQYDAMQFPVFPLQQMPTWRNVFPNMTVGTYADEFAENHFHTMRARSRAEAFVPSAGTGFALSRKILLDYNFESVFPEDSLTEDYKLSLALEQKGFHLHYVLENIQRLNDDGRLVTEFVSTRSRFPSTFSAAVRQKTRWIYGITMQSVKRQSIFKSGELNFIQRYSLYKDWKAKFGNLINLFGYMVFIYFILAMTFNLPKIYPHGSFSWYLCIFLTFMMVERQLLRAVAIKNVYGWRSVVVACLFPPLMPIRLIWGNIINLVATIKAWQQFWSGSPATSKKDKPRKPQKWDKTDHEFLEKAVLRRYHRRLGDALLERKLISAEDLKKSLQEAKTTGKRLGAVIRENKIMSEVDLLVALAQIQHTIFVPLMPLRLQDNSEYFGWTLLEELQAVPLLKCSNSWAVAISDESPPDAKERLERECEGTIYLVYSTASDIKSALLRMKIAVMMPEPPGLVDIHRRLEYGQINFEQVLLAAGFVGKMNEPLETVLEKMGMGKSIEPKMHQPISPDYFVNHRAQ